MTRNIVIYHEDLLAYSETFILNQGEALRQFRPYYVGTRRVDGIPTPPERTIVLNDRPLTGRLAELWYKATGLAPHLDRRLRELRPGLIHAHFGSNGVMALPLVRRLRLPLIVTFHGFDATTRDELLLASDSLRNRRLVTRRPQLIASGALLIAVSEHIRRQLLDRGYPPHRVVTHYNGIDTRAFTPAPEMPRENLVLFVGRFVEKKGTEYLLRAMRAVRERVPDARLVLVGDGPLRGELEGLARELGLGPGPDVRFVGRQTPQEVRAWMAAARVFCLPSVTARSGDTEGLPTVLLEALAMGVPTVTTRSAGNPEAVTDGETGLVVPERDAAGLAHALTRLLLDPALRGSLSAAALNDVRARFDAGQQARGLEALYIRAVERAASAGEGAQRPARDAEALDPT
ncbi:glycosyltransferase [Deinococcus sp. YIM 134068]|uniref:glycosyltransferase n=1 Tax=Deinococcus lichenicola TaxID=3118910 RepID=UPI002F94DC26